MKKFVVFVMACLCVITTLFAGDKDPDKEKMRYIDSVLKAMDYKTGLVKLEGDYAQLNVPLSFKFLSGNQANYVISDLWGNPPQKGILGLLVPENWNPFADSSYAFVVTFDDMGFVKDEDADKMNYDDLLKDLQKEEIEDNKIRQQQGYEAIHMIGWANKPFYDKDKKVLHWAKNLKFGNSNENTLNYDVRILGRKGVLSLNAIASMEQLDMVKKDIDKVLTMATFTEGNQYKDFDSKTDKIAAWTIGGLVAGKILAKVGFFAIFAKFFKVILIGIAAAGGAIWKFFGGRKKEAE